ncbi:hypothetical protein SynA1544_01749 [Synechococcus sp. A15-44]|nr:hypothetical protein SynA1544_01749 [Synechococcus sp. A15-44]
MTTTPASAGGMECLLNRYCARNKSAKINQSHQIVEKRRRG